jgi:hypothetical protein
MCQKLILSSSSIKLQIVPIPSPGLHQGLIPTAVIIVVPSTDSIVPKIVSICRGYDRQARRPDGSSPSGAQREGKQDQSRQLAHVKILVPSAAGIATDAKRILLAVSKIFERSLICS